MRAGDDPPFHVSVSWFAMLKDCDWDPFYRMFKVNTKMDGNGATRTRWAMVAQRGIRRCHLPYLCPLVGTGEVQVLQAFFHKYFVENILGQFEFTKVLES
jgi:hypothetical protein